MAGFQKWGRLGLSESSVIMFHPKLRLLKDSSSLEVSKPGLDTVFILSSLGS